MNQYGKYTQETFVNRASKIHNFIYDYSKVQYRNCNKKVCIICKIHGEFWQRPADHVRGSGCPKCGQVRSIAPSNHKAADNFINNCKRIHGDKYSYEKVNYISSKKKVIITCKKHGDFLIRPNNILNGQGCPECYNEIRYIVQGKDTEWFIKKAVEKFGNKYDYSLVNYINSRHKIKIICKKHGVFEIYPSVHLYGIGCPHCRESHGEQKVRKFLMNNKIEFIPQYKIENCSLFCNKRELRVDFYLPSRNIFIEYNGEQHYVPVKIFGGRSAYEVQVERDFSLKEYCKEHKINLIEIPYKEIDNIDEILAIKLNVK